MNSSGKYNKILTIKIDLLKLKAVQQECVFFGVCSQIMSFHSQLSFPAPTLFFVLP